VYGDVTVSSMLHGQYPFLITGLFFVQSDMSHPQRYFVQWHGRTQGPWTLGRLKSALQAGEINSMYQVQTDGGWLALRDFLESQAPRDTENTVLDEQAAAKQFETVAKAARERASNQAKLDDADALLPSVEQKHILPAAPQTPHYTQPMAGRSEDGVDDAPTRLWPLNVLISIAFILPMVGLLLSVICFCGNDTDQKSGPLVLLASSAAGFIYFTLYLELIYK
jgi:hypothetical protein